MIEQSAILFRDGTLERCCKVCYLHGMKKVQGIWCNYHDEKTRLEGVCGLFGFEQVKETVQENQNELFDVSK